LTQVTKTALTKCMDTQSNKPLSIPSSLAKNPKNKPIYAEKIKLLSGEEILCADPTATRGLLALMDMQAQMAGAASHFGGPSAFAEIMSSLHAIMFHESAGKKQDWFQLFNFVNDAGHCENGLYALKANYGFADLTISSLKGFRSIESKLTGHGESHLFPEGVLISNGPLGSSLPQSQGLCLADRLAGNNRVTVCAISDGGCMEGEAREALASIPGLAQNGKMNPFVLLISDNNTKLTGRIDKDAFSMKGTFDSLANLGWNLITIEKGNHLQTCSEAIEKALASARTNPKHPVALLFKTVKGIGTKKTAESASGGHGFPLNEPDALKEFVNEVYSNKTIPTELDKWVEELLEKGAAKKAAAASKPAAASDIVSEKVQNGVSKALIAKRKAGLPIISVSSDLPGSTGVAGFQKEFPGATQDIGVAESNMMSVAAGLSKMGFIPVVDTFAQFGVTKGALPLTMASLSQAPMICVFSHIGFQDAADGASHQGLGYISMLSSIPHVDVYVLTSSAEAEALVSEAVDNFVSERKAGRVPNSVVFFLGRENFPARYLDAGYKYRLGEAQVVFDNTAKHKGVATIVAMGALLHQALEAAYKLEAEGLGVIVVNPSAINHPDLSTLRTTLRSTQNTLLTVEDHQLTGGMGAIIGHALLQDGLQFKMQSLGVKGEFGQSAYKASDLYKKHGLDASAIADKVRKMAKA
jgi:transketolase